MILIVTEFGRTARVNGTVGTDHGTGTIALLVGGVRGGRVLMDWPGLKSSGLYESRDLAPTAHLRAVAKGLLRDLFEVSTTTLDMEVFPGTRAIPPCRDLVTI